MAGLANELVDRVRSILCDLATSPYPALPSPPEQPRRASVAFVLRISPSYAHWPSPTESGNKDDLEAFFEQEWVRHGEPEVLFIKRASRQGDRWTSHIALPGGKKDPEDVDDQAAAIREAWEEVGLDLSKHAVPAGNLPQRLVTTHWGKKPLLVLCPYVFLLTTPHVPPLRLQPTEVASTHWVPLRSLQSPSQRTVTFEDVSSRLANQETGVKKWMLRCILGKMLFAAINLVPTESLHSAGTPASDAVQLQDNRHVRPRWGSGVSDLVRRLQQADVFNQFAPPTREGPLLLWGLTLGVVSDFLDLLPPHDALTLWTYPTFTPLDIRFSIWLLTYRFRERKRVELQSGTAILHKPAFGGVSESLASAAVAAKASPPAPFETGLHGLGTGIAAGGRTDKKAAVSTMLEGCVCALSDLFLPAIADRARYYTIVRRAVALALINRSIAALLIAIVIYRKTRGIQKQ